MKGVTTEAELIHAFLQIVKQEGAYKLILEDERNKKEIYISNRNILCASSNRLQDKLSEILFRAGRLTQDQYMLSTELSLVTGKAMGEILMGEGLLSEQAVAEALRYQVRQIMASLFDYPEWRMRIATGSPDHAFQILPNYPLMDALMAGIRSVDNLTVLYEALPPKDALLEIAAEAESSMPRDRFTADETLLLNLVDGQRSLAQIEKASKMWEYRFFKTLYPLVALRLVQVPDALAAGSPAIESSEALSAGQQIGERPVRRVAPNRPCKPAVDTEALLQEAKFLISAEKFSAAANRLKQLIRLDSKKSAYYYYLGLALDHVPGQNKEAEKVLKIAIRLENYNPRYYLALGYLYLNRNMKRQARQQFMTACKWDPEDPYVAEALRRLDQADRRGSSFLTARLFAKSET
jgi:tetratricopeptide (TPR) repeat protein